MAWSRIGSRVGSDRGVFLSLLWRRSSRIISPRVGSDRGVFLSLLERRLRSDTVYGLGVKIAYLRWKLVMYS
jgi:hypothetical protein